MVLRRLSSTKREKTEMEKSMKKSNRKVKKAQDPASKHTNAEMKNTSDHVCKSVCRSMLEETRQQARFS